MRKKVIMVLNYEIDCDGLLNLKWLDDQAKISVSRLYYKVNLMRADIRTPNGVPVTGFCWGNFRHIISASSGRHSLTGLHDVELSEPRARALPLVSQVIEGNVDVTSYSHWNGARGRKETALVANHPKLGHYFVILTGDDGGYRIVTAFVGTEDYYRTSWIHGRDVSVAPWGRRTPVAA